MSQESAGMAVPELPEGWKYPFQICDGYEERQWGKYVVNADGHTVLVDDDSAEFITSLLNAVYSPTGPLAEVQRLRERVAELEKSPGVVPGQ